MVFAMRSADDPCKAEHVKGAVLTLGATVSGLGSDLRGEKSTDPVGAEAGGVGDMPVCCTTQAWTVGQTREAGQLGKCETHIALPFEATHGLCRSHAEAHVFDEI